MKIPLQIIESMSNLIQNVPDNVIQETLEEIDDLNACQAVTLENLQKADENSQIIDLSDSKLYHLPKKLSRFKNAKVLKLSKNNIVDYDGLENLQNLRYLIMDENYSKFFPHQVFSLKNLIYLNAQNNELHYLSNKIGFLNSLIYLNLENNLISYIPEQIKNCKQLKYFNLGVNKVKYLNYNFSENEKLAEVYFHSNAIPTAELESFTKRGILCFGSNGKPQINGKNGQNNLSKKTNGTALFGSETINISHSFSESKNNNELVSDSVNSDLKNDFQNVTGKDPIDETSVKWKDVFQNYIDLFSNYLESKIGRKVQIRVENDSEGLKLYTHSDENISFEVIQNHLQDYLNDMKNTSGKIKELIDNNELKRYEIFELRQNVRDIDHEKKYLEDKVGTYYEKVLLLKSTIDEQKQFIDSLKDEVNYLKTNQPTAINQSNDEQKQVIINIENKQINNSNGFPADPAMPENSNNQVDIQPEKFDPEKLLVDLYKKMIRLSERKYSIKKEDDHNDNIADFLRDKGYMVTDQTRSGISKKDSGVVDFIIRDKEGTPLSILEALRVKSSGMKNKLISDHVIRILRKYDTVGHPVAFLIIYAESQNFIRLWKNYITYLENLNNNEEYKDADCPVMSINESTISDKADIKIGVSKHKREEKEVTLYHLFVNMYVPQKETDETPKVPVWEQKFKKAVDCGEVPEFSVFFEYIKYLIEISQIKEALDSAKKYFELSKDKKSLNFILLKSGTYHDIRRKQLGNVSSKSETRQGITKIGYDLLEYISDLEN
jgi:Leucine-rich repeat (LRR) protein